MCIKDMAVACTGKMRTKVADNSDTRKIYTVKSGALVDFTYANVPPAYFNASVVSNLSQWAELDASQQAAAAGANLVNYLRGQTGYERSSAIPANRLYRTRLAILGDILQSKPVHVGEAWFQYADAGYNDFKTSTKTRDKTIYVGANDGMMHVEAGRQELFDDADPLRQWPACRRRYLHGLRLQRRNLL
jgi:type IV pilus assembly protein PilY1